MAGDDWQAAIRSAITEDPLAFIACFSQESIARRQTYQNEELNLAVDEMRRRPSGQPWLIPVRFNECEIPDINLGGGRTLRSLHWADLFGADASAGADRIISAVRRILGNPPSAKGEKDLRPGEDSIGSAHPVRGSDADIAYKVVRPESARSQSAPKRRLAWAFSITGVAVLGLSYLIRELPHHIDLPIWGIFALPLVATIAGSATWVRRRASTSRAGLVADRLDQAADRLAAAVREQWEMAAAERGLAGGQLSELHAVYQGLGHGDWSLPDLPGQARAARPCS